MNTNELVSLYKQSREWKSLSAQSQRSYSRYLDKLPSGDIDKIHQFEFGKIHNKLAPGAGNSFRAAIGALLKWGGNCGYTKRSVFLPINKVGEIQAWKPSNLVPYIEQATSNNVALAIAIGFYTAQRLGDILNMKWSDIEDNGIVVKQEKTGMPLVIPIHSKLQAILNELDRNGPYIVQHGGKRYTTNSFRVLYRKVVPSSMPPFHGVRKASCIALAEGGASTHEIMAMSGHTTLRMVSHYTKGVNKLKLAKNAIKAFD